MGFHRALKHVCLVLAVAGSFCLSHDGAWAAQNEASSKGDVSVAARVNGEPVTRGELQRLLADPLERSRLLQELGLREPDSKELHRVALQKLINRRLILQEAARRNFTVTEQELDKAITSLRRRFEDLKRFGAWMKEQGLDDQSLFEIIRAEMMAARVRAALVEGVAVTDEQVQQYYDAHKDDLKTEEVRLQLIVVEDRATAEEILTALQKGDAFAALARKRSIGRRAAQGGDTGWVDAETLWPPLRHAVGTMKARQAGGPIQRGAEFLVVRLDERRPGRTKSLTEARPEIERRLLPVRHQEAVQAWLAEQEKKSTIEVFPQAE
jgi:parvulin-like peptidyl-prolyl isomerase